MKSIYLIRHSEPQRLSNLPQEEWPLSEQGHGMAEAFFCRLDLRNIGHIYSSPLRRAEQTALHVGLPMTMEARLRERCAGKDMPEYGDCWLKQYEDGTFKCPGGESFDEVAQRMTACMDDVLSTLKDGEASVVISHAAAICAYLKQYCTIRVTDRATKTREVVWNGEQVYLGHFPPLTCFQLTFCQGKLENIKKM